MHPEIARKVVLFNRRTIVQLVGVIAVTAACSDITEPTSSKARPRLNARPVEFVQPTLPWGLHRVTRSTTRFIAYVPASALRRQSIPVNLLLHGSARDAEQLVEAHRAFADSSGVVVIAPYASEGTWDAIYDGFGPDLLGIDRTLAWLFDRLPVNPSRIAITGFSDGATYALAIGRANGDLFTRIVAYSPGFLIAVEPTGKPEIAISHGTGDLELPYSTTRDRMVPALRQSGYSVDFRSFDGAHEVLLDLVSETLQKLGGP
jgi:phospholipase/carboxylesterase